MKRTYYTGHNGDENVIMVSVPLENFNLGSMMKSFNVVSSLYGELSFDGYTLSGFKKFYEEGFTESRVCAAPRVPDSDSMVLFSNDEAFKSPIALAICFNGKFYAMDYKYGKLSEPEMLNIFKNKKTW